jgi:hypothetical protein
MKKQWLTIKEASNIVGKSENTIRRFIRDAQNEHLSNKSQIICKKEKYQHTSRWIIAQDSLFIKLGLTIQNDNLSNTKNKHLGNTKNELLNTQNESLTEIITILKDRINSLEHQLSQKDNQLSELMERIRELNLIFAKQEQQKQLEYKKKGFTRRIVDIILK